MCAMVASSLIVMATLQWTMPMTVQVGLCGATCMVPRLQLGLTSLHVQAKPCVCVCQRYGVGQVALSAVENTEMRTQELGPV